MRMMQQNEMHLSFERKELISLLKDETCQKLANLVLQALGMLGETSEPLLLVYCSYESLDMLGMLRSELAVFDQQQIDTSQK